jgi:hypothetical protein
MENSSHRNCANFPPQQYFSSIVQGRIVMVPSRCGPARLPRKNVAGGITGWIDEGFELARGADLCRISR